jgi:diaminopropionate ammonia-lyase
MSTIQWVPNRVPKTKDQYLQIMSLQNVQKAKCFHAGFPQYCETPLVRLDQMAQRLGLDQLFVKDESYRFGLNAFKVLGGSFAMANFIAQKLGRDVSELTYEVLTSPQLRNELGQFTFFTATDGNHGRGVAWAANKLGQKSVVLMPKGSSQTRLENIRKEGAEASITEGNYDECVRMAAALAARTPNSVVIQDTAWAGYEEIPGWIMQGYGTMANEAAGQLKSSGCDRPTHIFIQAGVGSLASSVQGYFANLYPGCCPVTVVVEPDQADCIYRSAAAMDGAIRTVDGAMQTIMAGLACGEPNTIGWDILKNHSAFFVSCPDYVAAKGMRMLGAPLTGDPRVISGESGAVTMGLVAEIMTNSTLKEFRAQLGLNANSRILLFSTEGDTDPENYLNIVHDGAYPSCGQCH